MDGASVSLYEIEYILFSENKMNNIIMSSSSNVPRKAQNFPGAAFGMTWGRGVPTCRVKENKCFVFIFQSINFITQVVSE